MPPKRHQQQQQQQRPTQPQQQQPRQQSVIGLPVASAEMIDVVTAWFAARIFELPALEQLARGRSLAIRLARQFALRDCYETVVEADSPVIAGVVAALLRFAAPAWRGQPLAETPLPGSNGTLNDALTAAGVMAHATAFAVAPSAPRPASPPPVPPVPDPRVEVLSPSPARFVDPNSAAPAHQRTRRPSHWRSLPAASQPRAAANATNTLERRLADEAEDRDPIWSSYRLPSRDLFDARDEAILLLLPRISMAKKGATCWVRWANCI